jgi:hypothetical protein
MRRGVTECGAASTSKTKSGRTAVQSSLFDPTEWRNPLSHSSPSGAVQVCQRPVSGRAVGKLSFVWPGL